MKAKFLFSLIASVFLFSSASAQINVGVRQAIQAKGYTWKEGAFDSILRMPRDTPKLRAIDSGAQAYKGRRVWTWTGARWDTIGGGSGSGGRTYLPGIAITIGPDDKISVDTAGLPKDILLFRRSIDVTPAGVFQLKNDTLTNPIPGTPHVYGFDNTDQRRFFPLPNSETIISKNIAELRARTSNITLADTGKIYQTILNGIPSNFVYTPSDVTSPDDGVMILVVNGKRVKRYIEDKVNARWFGALGDGVGTPLSYKYTTLSEAQAVYPFVTSLTQTIDYAGLQAAVNWCIKYGYVLRIPAGIYVINKGVILQKRDASNISQFFNLTVEGDTHSFSGDPGPETVIRCLHSDGFAFGIQKGKGVTIRDIFFSGQNLLNLTPTQVFDDNSQTFIVNSARENSLSPHVAIGIDVFGSAATATANRYPGFEPYYNEVSNAGSSDIKLEGITAHYFVNAFSVSPSGTMQNGDGILIDRCWISFCKNGVTSGSSQNRSLWIKNLKAWDNIKFVINCADFGDGTGAFPEVDGIDIAGSVKWLVKGSTFFSMASFIHVYAESIGGIGGNFNGQSNNYNFVNCTFHLQGAVPGVSRANATVMQGGDVRFVNSQLLYYGVTGSAMRINAPHISFVGCKLNAPIWGGDAIYINCDINSSYNQSTNFLVNVASPESINNGTIYVLKGQGYEMSLPNTTNTLKRTYIGPDMVGYAGLAANLTINESGKSYTFNAGADSARFQPGDKIFIYGPADEFGQTNIIPAGVVFTRVGSTVTVNGLTFGLTNSVTYAVYNYRQAIVTALHIGNIASGSNIITGVIKEGATDSSITLKVGMTVNHPAFLSGTYIKAIAGNNITVSNAATASESGAVIMPSAWSATVTADTTNLPHVGFLVGDVINNNFKRSANNAISSWVVRKAGIVGSQYPPIFQATGGGGSGSGNAIVTNLTGSVIASNIGGAATVSTTLAPTGVTAGTYANADIIVNSEGRVTQAANGSTVGANIFWKVGEGSFTTQGDSVYTNASFIGYKHFDVFRDGRRLYLDTADGVNIDTTIGKFIFHPPLVTGERIVINADKRSLLRSIQYSSLNVNTIPNIKAWFDASDPTTVTVSSGVSAWSDKSPNGFNVTQSSAGSRPTYVSSGGSNNQPYLHFAGGQYMQHHYASPVAGTHTIYMVIKQNTFSSNTYPYIFAVVNGGNGIAQQLGPGPSTTYWGYWGYDGVANTAADLNTGYGDWQIVKAVFRGGGVTKISKNRLGGFNRFNEVVGAGNPASITPTDIYFHTAAYDLSETIIIQGEPSTSDDNSIKTYLISKYGIVQRPAALFFGDSHTQGVLSGTPNGETYVNLAGKEKGYDIMNYGVSSTVVWPNGSNNGLTGQNLSDLYNDYDQYLVTNPYVIFQYGTNEGPNGVNATWKANYKAYIQHFLDLGVPANKIIICSPPYNSSSTYATNLANTRTTIQAIATEMGIQYCDFYGSMVTAGLDINTVPGGDGIHMNGTIARNLADKLKTFLP